MSRYPPKMWLPSRLGFLHQSNKDSPHIISSRMLLSSEAVSAEEPNSHFKFNIESDHQSTAKILSDECNAEGNGTGVRFSDLKSQSWSKFSLDSVLVRKWLEDQFKSLEQFQTELNEERSLLNSVLNEVISLRISSDSRRNSPFQTKQDPLAKVSHSITANSLEAVNTRVDNDPRIQEAECVETVQAKYKNDDRENEDQGIDAMSSKYEMDSRQKVDFCLHKELDNTSGAMKNELKGKFIHPDWPEWRLFLNILRNFVHINESKFTSSAGLPEVFSDATLLKQALVKFSQVHDSIMKHLSSEDLRALVSFETPTNDKRTTVAKERLQIFLHNKDSNTKNTKPGQVSLTSSNQPTKAKLTDVMRLVYRVLSILPTIGAPSVERKSALIHLLQAFVSFSGRKNCNDTVDVETNYTNPDIERRESSIVQNIKSDKHSDKYNAPSNHLWNGSATIPEIRGLPTILEWKCPRCSFTNLPQKTVCTQCGEKMSSSIACEPIMEESTEPRKFNSLKERVEARKARLEREQLQKQITNPQSNVVSPNLVEDNIPKESTTLQTKLVSKNFKALDELIDSDNSDTDDEQNGHKLKKNSKILKSENVGAKKNGYVFSEEARSGNELDSEDEDNTTDDDGIHGYGVTGGRRYGTHQHELMFQRGCYSEKSKDHCRQDRNRCS